MNAPLPRAERMALQRALRQPDIDPLQSIDPEALEVPLTIEQEDALHQAAANLETAAKFLEAAVKGLRLHDVPLKTRHLDTMAAQIGKAGTWGYIYGCQVLIQQSRSLKRRARA